MKATVTMTFTLTYQCRSGWGDDCTLGQLRKQSLDEAKRIGREAVQLAAEKNIRLSQPKVVGQVAIDILEREEA